MKNRFFVDLTLLLLFSSALAGCKTSRQQVKGIEDVVFDKFDESLGIEYRILDKVSLSNQFVDVELNGKTGTFSLYAVNAGGKKQSLLSTVDSGSTSCYFLKMDNKVYRLDLKSGLVPQCRQTKDGIQFCYLIDKVADVVLDFKFVESDKNCIELTAFVTNTSGKNASYSLKAVYDTILGEGNLVHFVLKDNKIVNSERQLFDFGETPWIMSSDGRNNVTFLFDREGVTVPECVTLANKDLVYRSDWVLPSMESRSFNSILSYNNSVVSINWPSVYLKAGETSAVKSFIAVTNSYSFVGYPKVNVDTEAVLESHGKEENPVEIIVDDEAGDFDSEEIYVSPDEITESQMDTAYIEDLLRRIDSFIKSGNGDSMECRRLNAEMDAILEKLGMN